MAWINLADILTLKQQGGLVQLVPCLLSQSPLSTFHSNVIKPA